MCKKDHDKWKSPHICRHVRFIRSSMGKESTTIGKDEGVGERGWSWCLFSGAILNSYLCMFASFVFMRPVGPRRFWQNHERHLREKSLSLAFAKCSFFLFAHVLIRGRKEEIHKKAKAKITCVPVFIICFTRGGTTPGVNTRDLSYKTFTYSPAISFFIFC